MRTNDFDFDLPPALIAQLPLPERSASRLLHVDKTSGEFTDRMFCDLPQLLNAGDLLIVNNTRVIKARLFGTKASGGRIEALIERVLSNDEALVQIRASHTPPSGSVLYFDTAQAIVVKRQDSFYHLKFTFTETAGTNLIEWLERVGSLPLPPYITRTADVDDEARYQTIYARESGAVAAPTAGLHFDERIMNTLKENGVGVAELTLHVGAGTFQPLRVDDLADHVMHAERFNIPQATVNAIIETKQRGNRIVAVGTTSLRALEAASQNGEICAGEAETNIFIAPGYRFRVVDALVTNFHLPRSTLFMLVSAFASIETMREAYGHAIEQRYRFFSYGDAMVIL